MITTQTQLVFLLPCKIPNRNRSINPPENVIPTPTLQICISMYARPANTQWIPYSSGATNRKVNSNGSVIPVSMEVSAAESNRPPTAFLFSGFAVRYIASAAPGRPKIISGNLPDINLVADTAKWSTVGSDNCAKKMFCAPSMSFPPTSSVPPTPVCQNGR